VVMLIRFPEFQVAHLRNGNSPEPTDVLEDEVGRKTSCPRHQRSIKSSLEEAAQDILYC
jgi:hypothetical protein